MRKIEVPTDSVPEYKLGTLWQIHSGGRRRRRQEKGRKSHKNRGRTRPGGRRPGGRKLYSPQDGVAKKHARTEKSDTETEAGGKAGISQ